MSYGVGHHRHGLDPVLLWLWGRLAAAAPIQPQAWEHPYAVVVVLNRQKKKKSISYSQVIEKPQKLMIYRK